jgi:hypothetical protein
VDALGKLIVPLSLRVDALGKLIVPLSLRVDALGKLIVRNDRLAEYLSAHRRANDRLAETLCEYGGDLSPLAEARFALSSSILSQLFRPFTEQGTPRDHSSRRPLLA